jgi:hypothetical protein
VPVNFPATKNNSRMLGFPFRLDAATMNREPLNVIIESGSAQQQGVLSIQSAGRKIISGNIGYDESEMYAQFKDMPLKDISDLPAVDFPEAVSLNQKITAILSHLTQVMKQQLDTDYYLFPVVLKYEKVELKNENNEDQTAYLYEIINEVESESLAVSELKALASRTIVRYENGEEIQLNVPQGYGVSPFLKVFRILELIFGHYRFEVIENPFKEHRQLKKLVVLNNTMDAILNGTICYEDLMPDCTIQEFLEILYAKFGMVYFVDSNARTVRIKLIRDLLVPGASGSIQLDGIKTEDATLSFVPPKQIRLKANREIDGTAVLADTYEEFLKKYRYEFTESNVDNQNYTQVFNRRNSLYQLYNLFKLPAGGDVERLQSSDFFDWDKKTPDMEYEEIEMKDLCLPFSDYDLYDLLYYAVDTKHVYTETVVSGETQENAENPAKPAFGWGQTGGNSSYFFASQINRDASGNFMNDEAGNRYDLSLTCNREDGLYNRFWKAYDAFIRHSNQEVNCRLHLTDR